MGNFSCHVNFWLLHSIPFQEHDREVAFALLRESRKRKEARHARMRTLRSSGQRLWKKRFVIANRFWPFWISLLFYFFFSHQGFLIEDWFVIRFEMRWGFPLIFSFKWRNQKLKFFWTKMVILLKSVAFNERKRTQSCEYNKDSKL